MMKNKKAIQIIVIVLVVLVSLIYLYSKGTYTSYETLTNGKITPGIAKWNIKVDGFPITTSEVQTIGLSNITWESSNAVSNKAVPGSVGVATITIDPVDTDVTIKYTLEFIDKKVDDSKFLEITSIADDDNSLIRTGENEYTGLITLDDINNKNTKVITLNVSWPVDGLIDPTSEEVNTSSNFLEINVVVLQYKGEDIVPYSG